MSRLSRAALSRLELIVEPAARASSMNSIGRQRPPIAIGRNRCCEDSPGPDARHWTGAAPFARTKLENYEPATDNAQAPNRFPLASILRRAARFTRRACARAQA